MTQEHAAPAAFDPLVPPGGKDEKYWIKADALRHDDQGRPKPFFSTSNVAMFFGRSPAWFRVRMRPSEEFPHGELVLGGKPIDIRRSSAEDRQFSLMDIERSAHALLASKAITRDRFACAITMVVACAVSNGMIPYPWPAHPEEPGDEQP